MKCGTDLRTRCGSRQSSNSASWRPTDSFRLTAELLKRLIELLDRAPPHWSRLGNFTITLSTAFVMTRAAKAGDGVMHSMPATFGRATVRTSIPSLLPKRDRYRFRPVLLWVFRFLPTKIPGLSPVTTAGPSSISTRLAGFQSMPRKPTKTSRKEIFSSAV